MLLVSHWNFLLPTFVSLHVYSTVSSYAVQFYITGVKNPQYVNINLLFLAPWAVF